MSSSVPSGMDAKRSGIESPTRHRRGGFTLIELLVVVAIIAVLLALLFPGLRDARDQARQVQCRVRVRGWVIALTMYADDRNGFLPPIISNGNLRLIGRRDLPAGLGHLYKEGYVSARGEFFCPSYQEAWSLGRPKYFDSNWNKNTGWGSVAYAYRPPARFLSDIPKLARGSEPARRAIVACGQSELPLNSAREPLADPASLPYGVLWPDTVSNTCFSHDWKGSNYALVDGSARWVLPGPGYSPYNDSFLRTAGKHSSSNLIWEAVSRGLF